MKRILFTMMLMVATLVTWAQRWNPVSNNSYSGVDRNVGLQQLTFMNRHSKVTYPMTYSY